MYTDPGRVGAFAVELGDVSAGEPRAPYKVLFATVMFQAMRDVLVQRILRRIPASIVDELTDPARVRARADEVACPKLRGLAVLRECTLTKDPVTKAGTCSVAPELACSLKDYTRTLGRYGHFGKVPLSLVCVLHEASAVDLPELYAIAIKGRDRAAAAAWLRRTLATCWRIHDKIACMFLSVVSNPDVLPGAPWAAGLDWTTFVVVNTNVDHFLHAVVLPRPMDLSGPRGLRAGARRASAPRSHRHRAPALQPADRPAGAVPVHEPVEPSCLAMGLQSRGAHDVSGLPLRHPEHVRPETDVRQAADLCQDEGPPATTPALARSARR